MCSWQPQRPRWHTATRWRAETGDPATGPAQVSPLRRYTWVIKACGRRQAPDFAADGLTVPSDDPGSMAHSSARQRQRSAIQQRARPVVGGRPVVRDQPSYQGFFISQGLHGNRDHAVISTRRSAAEEGSLDFHLDGGQPIIPRAIDPLSRAPLLGTRGVDPHGDSRRRSVPPGETSGGRGRCCHRCRRCRPVPFRPG